MEVAELMSYVGSVGFPIVACCAMFWLYKETITKITTTLDKLNGTIDKLEQRMEVIEDAIKRGELK